MRKKKLPPFVVVTLFFLILAVFTYILIFSPRLFFDIKPQVPDSGQGAISEVDGAGANSDAAAETKPAPAAKPQPQPKKPEPPLEKVDIVLIGSELEGMYLARAAADEGLKVKILDPRPALGGQLLQGEMLFLDEPKDDQNKSLVQGRVKKLFDGYKSGKIRKLPDYQAYYNENLLGDLPVESGIKIEAVETATGTSGGAGAGTGGVGGETVKSILYRTASGEEKRIQASYWVDDTDFAALISRLKSTRLPGLEAVYGQKNIEYMSTGFMMKFKGVDWKTFNTSFNSLTRDQINKKYGGGYVSDSYAIGLSGVTNAYKTLSDRVHLRGLNALNQGNGDVIINALLIYTVDPSDDKSVNEALELGKQEMPRILDHFRKMLPGWGSAELNGFPPYLYVREYNHYETDYVLQVSDLLGGKMFWDDVSIAGYPIDLQGTSVNKVGIEMGRPDKYGMPLRSFMLKDYANVIVAGKNVGASAIAYGSARIQPNTSLAAETIGVILGQIQGKKKLKELTKADMPALYSYLESKYRIKLTGVTGKNKIAGWSEDRIAKLNTGEVVYH
ncbi:MAG: dependent oxidoreductase [Paenibacillaceae bacterium]|nr:dependent oxidoreductase [Paenibacillaceae bacterium]